MTTTICPTCQCLFESDDCVHVQGRGDAQRPYRFSPTIDPASAGLLQCGPKGLGSFLQPPFKSKPSVNLWSSVPQTVPAENVEQILFYNRDRYDTDSMHDPFEASSRITVNTPGIYAISFDIINPVIGDPIPPPERVGSFVNTTQSGIANNSTFTVGIPASEEGDLIFVMGMGVDAVAGSAFYYANANTTAPSGWSPLHNSTDVGRFRYYRRATGTEGTTLQISTGNQGLSGGDQRFDTVAFVVRRGSFSRVIATRSVSLNPPNILAPFGSLPYLAIALTQIIQNSPGGAITGFPTGFPTTHQYASTFWVVGATNPRLGLALRQFTGNQIDPSSFAAPNVNQSVAYTILVGPPENTAELVGSIRVNGWQTYALGKGIISLERASSFATATQIPLQRGDYLESLVRVIGNEDVASFTFPSGFARLKAQWLRPLP